MSLKSVAKILFFNLLSVLVFSFVQGQTSGESARKALKEEVRKIEAQCDFSKVRVYCKNGDENYQASSWGANRVVRHELFDKLNVWASDLAQSWADTILEGPYKSSGDTELSRIVEIRKNGKTALFRITYFEEAYHAESCSDVPSTFSEKGNCETGVIVESSFIDKTATHSVRSSEKARFVPVKKQDGLK